VRLCQPAAFCFISLTDSYLETLRAPYRRAVDIGRRYSSGRRFCLSAWRRHRSFAFAHYCHAFKQRAPFLRRWRYTPRDAAGLRAGGRWWVQGGTSAGRRCPTLRYAAADAGERQNDAQHVDAWFSSWRFHRRSVLHSRYPLPRCSPAVAFAACMPSAGAARRVNGGRARFLFERVASARTTTGGASLSLPPAGMDIVVAVLIAGAVHNPGQRCLAHARAVRAYLRRLAWPALTAPCHLPACYHTLAQRAAVLCMACGTGAPDARTACAAAGRTRFGSWAQQLHAAPASLPLTPSPGCYVRQRTRRSPLSGGAHFFACYAAFSSAFPALIHRCGGGCRRDRATMVSATLVAC